MRAKKVKIGHLEGQDVHKDLIHMKGSNCGIALEHSNPFFQVDNATTSSTIVLSFPFPFSVLHFLR